MSRSAAMWVVLATTLAFGAVATPARASDVPAVERALGTVAGSLQAFEAADRALGAARAHHDELAHRITALKRVRGGGGPTLTELLERSVAAERDLGAKSAARDRAKLDVERRVTGAVQLIDDHIRDLRPRLKSASAAERTEVARRLKGLLADRDVARGGLTKIAERPRPKAWAQYEVKVEALDGPADLREKADFVEDTRDKLKKKREALERMVADARQAREIARAAVNFRTEVGLFDEQSRTGRVVKSEGALSRAGGDAQVTTIAEEQGRNAALDPQAPGVLAPPQAPDDTTDRFGAAETVPPPGPDKVGGGAPAPAPAVGGGASPAPLPRSVDPSAVLNVDVRSLGANGDVTSIEGLLRDLAELDELLGSQASQIRRRAQALEADEAAALRKN